MNHTWLRIKKSIIIDTLSMYGKDTLRLYGLTLDKQIHSIQKQAKEDKDGKHICPLQLDVIERCIALWTNPNDLVFSPFTGIGSEGYQAIKQGRKFVGSELKDAYFNVAVNNLQDAVVEKRSLFDEKIN